MIPSLSTGGGGFDGGTSSAESGGSAGGVGDKFATLGGTDIKTSLFSNTGVRFGDKGINTTYLLLGVVVLGSLFILKK